MELDLKEPRCENVDWINLAQDRDKWILPVGVINGIWFPSNVENFLTSCGPVSC